jgi:hypothetical protein
MSRISHKSDQPWNNYHKTRGFSVHDEYRFEPDPLPHPDGPTRWAETAATLKAHLATLAGKGPAGTLGTAWSLNDLVGNSDRTVFLDQLGGRSWVEPHHLHQASRFGVGEAVFVGGGTSWAALVDFIEHASPARSILTCGSYLSQSIAGSVATSTAGSRLGKGAVQNQIVGMHLVTAADESVWIERRTDPVLGHVAVDIADRVIRDDDLFADALVHLGGMGLVNGLIVETVPCDLFSISKWTVPVDQQWLTWLRKGDFASIAGWLGRAGNPAYYEVQVDPFDLFKTPALHTMYFQEDPESRDAPVPETAEIARASRVHDAIAHLDALLAGPEAAAATPPLTAAPGRCGGSFDCNDPRNALTDLYNYYSCCFFEDIGISALQSWGQIHSQPPNSSREGNVFSSAFAVKRDDIEHSLLAISGAASGRPRHFLYTLRFVSNAAGTLAFQQFPESVVIDFEGLKPTPEIELLTAESLRLAHMALDTARIEYRVHWGKLGSPDAAKILADYGGGVARWKAARTRLLGTDPDPALQNDALIRWKMV